MKLEPNTTPAEVAQAIVSASPGCPLDFALLVTRFVSKQLTQDAIASRPPRIGPKRRTANVTTVIATVCEFFVINEAQLLGKSKSPRFARPRHALWLILRTDLAMSVEGVTTLSGCTRRTVRAGCSAVDTSTAEWSELRQRVTAALRPAGLVEAAE